MISELTFEGQRPLKNNRSFVTLMVAQAISNLGDWLHLLAILTLVGIRWNATPWEITFVMLSAALPMLATLPHVGTSLILLASAILYLQFADSQTVVLFRQLPGISSDLLGWCV